MKTKSFQVPKWSKLNIDKLKPIETEAGSWPMMFFSRNWRGQFIDLNGELIRLKIRNPKFIDFYNEQLEAVQNALANLTDEQRNIAQYFGFRSPTKQWTPIIDRLVDTYNVTPPRAARILSITNAAMNDALILTWHLKYVFDVARPNQVDPTLQTIITTPSFPAYPSGHATLSGCAETVLSYFFPCEAKRLKEIAEEAAMSRLYAGIHFPADNQEGLRLGRQIGQYIVSQVKDARNSKGASVDIPYNKSKGAVLPPPPYEQVIPFPPVTETAPRRNPLFML